MKFILGWHCIFMGHEFCQSEILKNLMAHENHFQYFCKLFMAHENQPSKFHGSFTVLINAMKPEISVFMAIKNASMGFSRHFHGIFMKKRFIV